MKRRNFIKSSALGSLALGLGCWQNPTRTHILSLSFGLDSLLKRLVQVDYLALLPTGEVLQINRG